MSTKNECCPKCRISNAPPYALPNKYCSNCSCHKPTESWEELFDREWGDAPTVAFDWRKKVKHFIRATIHSQREELCGRLEGLRQELRLNDLSLNAEHNKSTHIYNRALDDAIQAIKNND